MILTIYIFWALVIFLIYFSIVDEWSASRSPATFFVIFHTGIFIATSVLSDFALHSIDSHLCNFIGFGLSAFVLGCLIVKFTLKFKPKKELLDFANKPFYDDLVQFNRVYFNAVLAFSLLVAITFITQIGIIPLIALKSLIFSGVEDVQELYNELRRDVSHGEQYLAPGYASQFKDWLLSLSCVILYLKNKVKPSRIRKRFLNFLVLFTILSLISTGARGNLVWFGFAFIALFSSKVCHPFNWKIINVLKLSIFGILLLSLFTVMMGKVGEINFINIIFAGPIKIVERIFVVISFENIQLYRMYISEQSVQWGAHWLDNLRSILPGSQESLSVEFAKMLNYGKGNATLHIWVSYLFNFGWFGLLLSILWGAMLQSLYVLFIRGEKTIIRLAVYMYSFVILFKASDPFEIILYGGAIFFLFYSSIIFTKVVFKRSSFVSLAALQSSKK